MSQTNCILDKLSKKLMADLVTSVFLNSKNTRQLSIKMILSICMKFTYSNQNEE